MQMDKLIAIVLLSSAYVVGAPGIAGAQNSGRPTEDPLEATAGLVRKRIVDEDPGPPIYARVSTIMNETFVSRDGWLVIPFYRSPDCVPADFNLLQLFDVPGADGAGAFACPLLVTGALLIEPDAPLGTFPRIAQLRGSAVPFWFVPYHEFEQAAADGVVTIGELKVLRGRLAGVASSFHEVLKPRPGDHKIEMTASGQLENGRRFAFSLLHMEKETKNIVLKLE